MLHGLTENTLTNLNCGIFSKTESEIVNNSLTFTGSLFIRFVCYRSNTINAGNRK